MAVNGETKGDVIGTLKEAADALIEERKGRLSHTVRGFAAALHRSAAAFAEEGVAPVARAADRLGDEAEELSDNIGTRHWRDMLADLEDGARARPELLFAATVAAGFLLGRFLASGTGR